MEKDKEKAMKPPEKSVNLVVTPVFEGLFLANCFYVSVVRTTDSDLHCTTNTALPYKEPTKKSLLPNIHRPPSGKANRPLCLTMTITPEVKLQQAMRLKQERELFYAKLSEDKALRDENPLVYEKSLVSAMIQDFQSLG